jgi:hypothetical protein
MRDVPSASLDALMTEAAAVSATRWSVDEKEGGPI